MYAATDQAAETEFVAITARLQVVANPILATQPNTQQIRSRSVPLGDAPAPTKERPKSALGNFTASLFNAAGAPVEVDDEETVQAHFS